MTLGLTKCHICFASGNHLRSTLFPKIGFKYLNNFNNLNGVKVFKVLNDLNRNNKKMPSSESWTAFFIDYKDFTPRKRYLP